MNDILGPLFQYSVLNLLNNTKKNLHLEDVIIASVLCVHIVYVDIHICGCHLIYVETRERLYGIMTFFPPLNGICIELM